MKQYDDLNQTEKTDNVSLISLPENYTESNEVYNDVPLLLLSVEKNGVRSQIFHYVAYDVTTFSYVYCPIDIVSMISPSLPVSLEMFAQQPGFGVSFIPFLRINSDTVNHIWALREGNVEPTQDDTLFIPDESNIYDILNKPYETAAQSKIILTGNGGNYA